LIKKSYIYPINITIEESAQIRHIAAKLTRSPPSPVAAKTEGRSAKEALAGVQWAPRSTSQT
jgi:hypothetical protein